MTTATVVSIDEAATWRLPPLADRLLDALDDAPIGRIVGEVSVVGRIATIQQLATVLRCSDGAARNTVHALRLAGLVDVFDALDPRTRRRRLFVTGEAQR